MNKYILVLLLGLLVNVQAIYAQSTTIQGIVKDVKGALSNASVTVKGTTTGNSTSEGGGFTVTVKKLPVILVINHVGYAPKEVSVNSANAGIITIDATNSNLDEVVIVGYQKKSKNTLIGSVSQISGSEIDGIPSSNVQNLLAGKLSGVSSQQRSGAPGRDNSQFYIRGVNSINGASNPLIIVDDIEYSYDQMSQIAADQIETISVLKDAVTTAVYGIKGANGVLLITTKRGKVSKPQFNVSTLYGLNQYAHTPKFLNSYDFATVRNTALANDGLLADFTQQDLDLFKSGADPYGHPNTDWVNVLTKKSAPQYQADLNISGGSELLKYFISLSTFNQSSQIRIPERMGAANPSNNYTRQNFRTNLDITPNKRLKIGVDISGAISAINEPNGTSAFTNIRDVWNELWAYNLARPIAPAIRNPNGTWASNRFQPAASFASLIAESGYQTQNSNIISIRLDGTHQLDFITQGLSARLNGGYTAATYDTRFVTRGILPAYSYDINTKTYTNTNSILQTPAYTAGGSGTAASLQRTFTANAQLNYNRRFGDHSVGVLIVYNQRSYTDRFLLPVNSNGVTTSFDYTYQQRYGATITYSRYGTDKYKGSKRFGNFPAAGVMWNLGEEKFFKEMIPAVNKLKFNATLGLTGSSEGPAGGITGQVYTAATNYNLGATSTPVATISEGALVNTDINWEVERKFGIGMELGLFNNLTLKADYFNNYRYDQVIALQNVSTVFGQTLGSYNLGESRNKGWEFELTYNGKIGKFRYTVSPNFSYSKNAIINNGTAPIYPYLSPVGKPIGLIPGYITDGFISPQDMLDYAAGKQPVPSAAVRAGFLKYRDLNGDNIVDSRDQALIGKPNLPTTIFGLNLNLGYKNFNISALLQGATNYSIKLYDRNLDLFNANSQPIHLLAWTPETAATAKYPVLTTVGNYNYGKLNNSDFWYLDPTFVRLKQLQVSYTLPISAIAKFKLKSMALTATGYNLLTWTNYNQDLYQVDPEVSSISTAGSTATTLAQSSTPIARQFLFGLRIGF